MAEKTAEEKIFDRLSAVQSFHPAGAKLFVPDWTLEPGDVVTVRSGDDNYKVPIYSMNLQWSGQSTAEIQSTGNRKREPLSALKRKEYNSRAGSYRIQQKQEEIDETFQEYETWKVETDRELSTHAAHFVEILGEDGESGRLTAAETAIEQTSDDITITAMASGLWLDENGRPRTDEEGNFIYDPDAANTTLYSKVNVNAQHVSSIVAQTGIVGTNMQEFDPTKTYEIGDKVLYDGKAYKFTVKHEGTEQDPLEWNPEHVTAVDLQTLIDENTSGISEITGSTLWQNKNNISLVVGKFTVNGNDLIINEGSGLKVYDGGTAYGVFTDNQLTAGLIVDRINNQGSGEGQTVARITADKIILDGTATATTLDARLLNVDQLFSTNGYSGTITSGVVNVLTGLDFYSLSSDTYKRFSPKSIYIGNTLQTMEFLGNDSNHSSFTIPDGIASITVDDAPPAGKVGFKYTTFTNSTPVTVNFNIADTQYYKDGVSAARNSIELYDYTWSVTSSDSASAAHGKVYSVSLQNAKLGYQTGVADDQPVYEQTKIYNSIGPQYITDVYNAGWEAGSAESGTGFDEGYAAGQTNADAVIHSISFVNGSADYINTAGLKRLDVDVYADPDLVLKDKDGVQQPPITKTGMTDTLGLSVAVTDVTITDSSIVYNNDGTYTIGGIVGNVNIGAVNGTGGANIPVDVTPYNSFTPTGAIADALGAVTSGTGTIGGTWGTDATDTPTYHKYNLTASIPIKSDSSQSASTLLTATAEKSLSVSISDVLLSASFSNTDSQTFTGKYTLGVGSGGLVSIDGTSLAGINAGISSSGVTEINLSLETDVTIGEWDTSTHTYPVTADSSVKQGTVERLTKSDSGTVTPTEAINYGKSLVGLNHTFSWNSTGTHAGTYTIRTSGRTNEAGVTNEDVDYLTPDAAYQAVTAELIPASSSSAVPLTNGTYGLFMVKNGTADAEPISYYSVTSGASVTYVTSSSGEPINVWSGTTILGKLYPNTDVTVGTQTDSLRRRMITYRSRSGYVTASALSSTKGNTNYIGRIGWVDEGGGTTDRTVESLSEIVLGPADAGVESEHSVDVVYSDGSTVQDGATVTIDATAITGGSNVNHISKSGSVSYSNNYHTVSFNVTAYSDSSESSGTALHTNLVSADITEAYNQGKIDGAGQVITGSITSVEKYLVDGYEQAYDETNHRYTVHVKAVGTGIDNSPYTQDLYVPATRAYAQGAREAVTGISFSSTDIGDTSDYNNVTYAKGTVTANAMNGSTVLRSDDVMLVMTEGAWSNNRKAVNIRVGSNTGNRIARFWVTAPSSSVNVDTPYINNLQRGYIRAAVVVNGQTYYGSAIKLTNAQISAWGGPIS